MSHKQRQQIPIIADAEPSSTVEQQVRAAVESAVRQATVVAGKRRVSVELDADDAYIVGTTNRMLGRTAPQPDVADRLLRVGNAMVEAATKESL